LDVAIFQSLAKYYSQLIHNEAKYGDKGIIKREWITWIQLAREKANIQANVISA
jgi:hypothetical protein